MSKHLFWEQASCAHSHSRLHLLVGPVGPPPLLTADLRAEPCATEGVVFPTRVFLFLANWEMVLVSMPSKRRGLLLILYFNLPCLWNFLSRLWKLWNLWAGIDETIIRVSLLKNKREAGEKLINFGGKNMTLQAFNKD